MHDRQHGALEIGQRLLEACPRGDVEVVDGFIQYQEGAALRDQQRQHQAGAFAVGVAAAGAQRIIPAEQEEMQEVARLGLIEGGNLLDGLQDRSSAGRAVPVPGPCNPV